MIFVGFKVTNWRKGSGLLSNNPLLSKGTDGRPGYETPVPGNSFPQSFPSSDESPWDKDRHASEYTDFGVNNQNRKKRSYDDDLEEAERRAIYPGKISLKTG